MKGRVKNIIMASFFATTLVFITDGLALAEYHHVNHCMVCHNIFGGGDCGDYTNLRLIYCDLSTPNSGIKTVKFTCDFSRKFPCDPEGTNSYADGDAIYDGVCEVCHTQTRYHRNDGSGEPHYAGEDCITCHPHSNEFSHGGGASVSCESCHGHDAGYEYAPGQFSQGAGTYQSHSTHTENDSDDLKGPNLACDVCHNTSSFPHFADGQTTLVATTVCDDCHSSGGTYDGLDDATVGAKNNWTSGVYDHAGGSPHILQNGKEKWCATCHDEIPSNIAGIDAPNIVGDESGVYTYGIGWGYYKTGHGLTVSKSYPSKGGLVTLTGRPVNCDSCHDQSMKHIDNVARTYVKTATLGEDNDYQHGYRLKSVEAQLPLLTPRLNECADTGVDPSDFRLCLTCHDSGPFIDPLNMNTSFRNDQADDNSSNDVNAHYTHLVVKSICGPGPMASSDWSFTGWDSRALCTTCHNVHGSTQLSMVRDGKLVDREPGLPVVYYRPGVTTYLGDTPPSPADTTLADSTGTVWSPFALDTYGFCGNCHGSGGFNVIYNRSPFDVTPPEITSVYSKIGSNLLAILFSEAVYTNTGADGDLVNADFVIGNMAHSITATSHSAGDDFASIALSSALGVDDLGTGQLSAATDTSIYDWKDNAMAPAWVTITDDSVPPVISNQSPPDSSTDINVKSDITFSLADSASGVDWTTFSITLTGNKGYSKVYTDADTLIVSRTGTAALYDITVNPDENFGSEEVITVTVNADDRCGNALVAPAWSFTAAQMFTLHPSALVSSLDATAIGGTWADILDSDDGDTTHAACTSHYDGGGPTFGQHPSSFHVEMDDAVGLGATASEVRVYFVLDFVTMGGGPPGTADTLTLYYDTGTAGQIPQVFNLETSTGGYTTFSLTGTTDGDGGSLEAADIQNMRVGLLLETREGVGWITTNAYVTEVYVEVDP